MDPASAPGTTDTREPTGPTMAKRSARRCPCGEVARTRATDYDGTVLHLCEYHHRFWMGERLAIELDRARWDLAESMADDERSPGDK